EEGKGGEGQGQGCSPGPKGGREERRQKSRQSGEEERRARRCKEGRPVRCEEGRQVACEKSGPRQGAEETVDGSGRGSRPGPPPYRDAVLVAAAPFRAAR